MLCSQNTITSLSKFHSTFSHHLFAMLVCIKLIFRRIDACHASNPLLPANDAHREAIVAETRIYDEARSIVRGLHRFSGAG